MALMNSNDESRKSATGKPPAAKSARPVPPAGLLTPGIIYRERNMATGGKGWRLMWSPPSALVRQGFEATNRHLWEGAGEPTIEEWRQISQLCLRYRAEADERRSGGPKTVFDGTWGSLIKLYQTDPDSKFVSKHRHDTRTVQTYLLRDLVTAIGMLPVRAGTEKVYEKWHRNFANEVPGETHLSRAHEMMKRAREVLSFGAKHLPDPHAEMIAKQRLILSECQFAGGRTKREKLQSMDWQMTEAFIAEARRRNQPGMALAQALQFECGMRQKDIIGEWTPLSEEGASTIVVAGQKWMRGVLWSEVNEHWVLRHVYSKGIRLGFGEEPKPEAHPLAEYQMVARELEIATKSRSAWPAFGPMITDSDGVPFRKRNFQKQWRKIADAAGIPQHVQNRDNRSGAVMETIDPNGAGFDIKTASHFVAHADEETTRQYYADHKLSVRAQIGARRAASRKRNT
jgi:integrase